MSGQVAVAGSEIGEPLRQQLEMSGLLDSHADPIVEKGAGQRLAAKPRDDVPGEIDRVELDMRDGVKQSDAPGRRAESPSLRHLFRRAQLRPHGACRARRRHRIADIEPSGAPDLCKPAAGRGLCRRIGSRKNCDRPAR